MLVQRGYANGVFVTVEDVALVEQGGVPSKYTYAFRLKMVGDLTGYHRASIANCVFRPFTFNFAAKPVLSLPPGAANPNVSQTITGTRTGGPPTGTGANLAFPYIANYEGWGVSYTGVTDATIIGNVGGVTTGYEDIGQGPELYITNGLVKARARFYQSVRRGNMDHLIWVASGGTGAWAKVGEINFYVNGNLNGGAPNAYNRQYLSGYTLIAQRLINKPEAPLSELGCLGLSWQVLPNGLRIAGVIVLRRNSYAVGFDLKNTSTTTSIGFGAILEQPQYSFNYVTRGNLGTLTYNTMTKTTLSAAYRFQSPSTWTDDTALSVSGGTPYVMLGASTDFFYFGAPLPFSSLQIVLSTLGSVGTVKWEYSQGNGNWATFTPDITLMAAFAVSNKPLEFQPFNDWHPDLVNAATYYWVRVSVASAATPPQGQAIVITQQQMPFDPSAALQYTASAYVDDTTLAGTAGNTTNFPILAATADYFYVGLPTPFAAIAWLMKTAGNYGVMTWQYSQGGGAWATLTITADGSTGFTTSGVTTFTPPGDWATDSVSTYAGLYWVRVATATYTTTAQYYQITCLVPSYASTTSEDAAIDSLNYTYWATAASLVNGTIVAGIIGQTEGNGRRYEQVNIANAAFTKLILGFDYPNFVPADQASAFEMVWFFALVYDANTDNSPAELAKEAMADVTVTPNIVAVA